MSVLSECNHCENNCCDNCVTDKHSVGCYFCGRLVDERECIPADEYNENDGGSICPECLKIKEINIDKPE